MIEKHCTLSKTKKIINPDTGIQTQVVRLGDWSDIHLATEAFTNVKVEESTYKLKGVVNSWHELLVTVSAKSR